MSQIKIGWAFRDVSTDRPIDIPGQFHMRISEGIADPVTANVLVLDDGQDQVVFLSCDLTFVHAHLLDNIREKVAKINPQISTEKILMNATHTHCGPSHEFFEQPFDFPVEVASSDEYRDYLSTQCAEIIDEAWNKRAEGAYAYGYGFAVTGHSRRVCYFDDLSKRPGALHNSTIGVNGTAAMYGNTNDDNFSHYEAGMEAFINLFYTYDVEGKLTGAIINVPCPSQNSEMNYELTADYWNDVRQAIRAKYGDIYILAQCAAAGDLAPRIMHYKSAQDRRFSLKYGTDLRKDLAERKDIAERISVAFDEVLAWASKDIRTEAKITHVVETVQLSKRLITDEEYEDSLTGYAEEMAKQFITEGDPKEIMTKNSILVTLRNRHKEIIDRYEEQKTEPKLPMELHVLRVGDIAFASNRFELYMDFQHRIQARSPFEQTFIIQLAGQPGTGGGTYLCTERGFEGRGYSASRFCNLVSPQGGQELVDETVKILKQIY